MSNTLLDPYSWARLNLIKHYSFLMGVLTIILIGTRLLYYNILISYNSLVNINLIHNSKLEYYWTMCPLLSVIIMRYFGWLVLGENELPPTRNDICVKIIGQMWYWTYELFGISFDSILIRNYNKGNIRYLDLDNILILPTSVNIKLNIYSLDVIHSWRLMQLGVKMDAVPGRGNSVTLNLIKPGIMYGFCSELCGEGHSMMPIILKRTQ